MASGKADSSSLASVATSGSYNDLSTKPTLNYTANTTEYTVTINNRNPEAFYKALMYYQNGWNASYGLYIIFIAVGTNNPTITVNKLAGSTDITFTGTYISNTQLKLTASAQIWGGIDIIEH